MTRTVWGGILLALYALGVIGSINDKDRDTTIGAGIIMFALPGAALVLTGQQTQHKLNRFASTFNNLSANGEVSSLELQRKAHISSVDVYKLKNLAEQRGLIACGVDMK